MLSSMAQHLFHLLAPNLFCSYSPSLLLPFSISLSPIYSIYIFCIGFSLAHTHTNTVCLVQECVCVDFSRPRGPSASLLIQCCSLHYPLYLSICPSVHHCLHPAAHLAVLLASLPHTASIAALLWVTFKDQAPLLINTETAARYSMSVLSSLPSSSSSSSLFLFLFQSQKCCTC